MKRTLYFEGAGCVPCNDVENCRIRTAFTNRDGQKIFIEFIGCRTHENKKVPSFNYLVCDACHYITDDPEIDDCNNSRLSCERSTGLGEIKYTKENILAFVNENCNAGFTDIVVLDDLAGFRALADGRKNTPEAYNYGDCFEYDEELTEKRIAKVNEMKKHFCGLFHQKYDNTSYFIENGELVARICVSDRILKESGWTKGRKFDIEV